MQTTIRKRVLVAGAVGLVLVACEAKVGNVSITSPTAGEIATAACPELMGGAMNANFAQDPRTNATIRSFVTASGDLAKVANGVETDVFGACERMATDLGVPTGERQPKGDQAKTTASCNAVASRIGGITKQGGQVHVDVVPPQCAPNAPPDADCRNQCNATGNADPRCNTSCTAHADLTAQCSDPQVRVQTTGSAPEAKTLATTLERNLLPLVKAQGAYGERIAGDVDALVRTSSELPQAFRDVPTKTSACLAAAANSTLAAQKSLRISIDAARNVSATAGMGAPAGS